MAPKKAKRKPRGKTDAEIPVVDEPIVAASMIASASTGPRDLAEELALGESVIEGTLERVMFHNPTTQYSVVQIETMIGRRETVVGTLYQPAEGQHLRIRVRAIEHRKYGKQHEIVSYEEVLPTSREGLVHYLTSKLVKGIGQHYARAIVEAFGDATINVLDHEPHRLAEIKGLGKKRRGQILESWKESRHMSELMMFLGAHGIGPGLASRIYDHYGGEAIARIQADPYQLALEVDGIGFRSADLIARRLGLPADAPRRIQAGLLYACHQQTQAGGHCCLPRAELVEAACRELALDRLDEVDRQLSALFSASILVHDESVEAVYLPVMHRAEKAVARRLVELAIAPEMTSRRALAETERSGVRLTDRQVDALATAFASRVSVITGGPGVGKTTLVRQLVATAEAHGMIVALAAPTGRAAKRLSEATGKHAVTIHRLLGYRHDDGGDFRAHDAIEADLIVIDETSMVDLLLMRELMAKVPDHATIVFVGDADQLPSVGPGNVLADLVASRRFPVAHLDEVFRQAAGSRIVEIAHEVNAGRVPSLAPPSGDALGDFYFARADDPARAADVVQRLVTERIPKRYGFDPVREVQVITPMHKGEVGTHALNERLQAALNPHGLPITVDGRTFRTRDKVMQTRNNYDLEIYNGDIGEIVDLIPADQLLEVAFDGRRVRLAAADLDDLQLAYCITVHKSQGSEYPAVVLVLSTQHHVMLKRNLLYTALTRGKRLVVIVGSERALEVAVRSGAGKGRHSRLSQRIAGSQLGSW